MNELTLVHPDAATTIFNLNDYRVLGVETLSFGRRRIHIESTVESGCPGCGVIGTRRHSGRQQRVHDIPVAGPVEVVWAKRRLFCDESSSFPRRTFFEATIDVPARAGTTNRLRSALVRAVIDSGRAATEAATAHGVSWWLVQNALTTAATKLPNVDLLRPRMLRIDEHRFRSVRFFKDPETRLWKRIEPWMTTIVDLDTGQILGVVDGRDRTGVGAWLIKRPIEPTPCALHGHELQGENSWAYSSIFLKEDSGIKPGTVRVVVRVSFVCPAGRSEELSARSRPQWQLRRGVSWRPGPVSKRRP